MPVGFLLALGGGAGGRWLGVVHPRMLEVLKLLVLSLWSCLKLP